jgi:hypothetical protein
MFISGKSGSFSDFEFSLREIFITDGSDRVCTLLEIYHLFSRGYIWAAHTVLCTWKSIRLSDWSNQPSLTLAGPTRLWELAGQTQVTHIYAGGHDSYSSVQVRLRVIRPAHFELQWFDRRAKPYLKLRDFQTERKRPALAVLDRWGWEK